MHVSTKPETRTRTNFADVFHGSNRTLAARKAAEARRSKLQAEERDARLNTFRFVIDSNGHLWPQWRFDCRKTTLPDAIANVIEESRFEDGDGYDLPDVAVWLANKLVATIRIAKNGEPIVTIFDEAV